MSYRDVEPAGLAEVFALPGLTIIDQRDDVSRREGHLEGSLAAEEQVLAQLVRQRRNDPPVLVYCYHGNQSRDLCRFLVQLGLQRVYNLAGGWDALQKWQAAQI